MKRLLLILVCLLALASPLRAEGGEIRWEPHTGAAFDGSPLAGELGRLRVPENRGRPAGPTIELAVVRWRTTHPDPGPPIFFLAGGPGASGVLYSATTATHPQIRLLEHSDVIAVDQRGTGRSLPNLMAPECVAVLPHNRAIDRAEMIAGLEKALRRCARDWRRGGIDPQGYNTLESADDIDAVRQALGLEKIVLFGSSYGSHLALAYLRRHPEHVERAVLTKVEGPDHTWKLPSTVQRQLEALSARIAADPRFGERFPDFLATVRELLTRLTKHPATVEHEGARLTVGALDLRIWLARSLATTTEIAAIPATLDRFEQGDWSVLAATARENRRPSLPPMALLMDCASGASAERRARIEREAADAANLLGDALMAPLYPELCRAAGARDLGAGFRGPLASEVPTLFVSGTLDVRTPPSNVEAIRAGFAHHAHVIVSNAGHEARELMSEEYRDLLQAFLRGERVESCTIALPTVRLEGLRLEGLR